MNYLGKQLSNLPYDATTQFNIFEDPLFAIRKQIQNKDYRLRKMGYLRKRIICGLDLDMNRLRHLLIENNKVVVQEIRCPPIPPEHRDDPLNFIKKYVYQQWVKL